MTSPLIQLPNTRRGPRFFGTLLLALRMWSRRQVLIAVLTAVLVAVVIGVATVLIPNPLFARDIPPVWWNYPVWLLTSVLSGVLVATYVRSASGANASVERTNEPGDGAGSGAERGAERISGDDGDVDRSERRTSRMGMAGGVLAWFAVGCPVCNKIALLALGYSGAITYFTPIQPFLAVGAMALTGVAVVARLRGQVSCPVPPRPRAA